MVEILIGATVLIVAVTLIRRLTKGRISMSLRYGLWILVALRLMVPINLGGSPYSAVSMLQRTVGFFMQEEAPGRTGTSGGEDIGIAGGNVDMAGNMGQGMAAGGLAPDTEADAAVPADMMVQGGIAGSMEEKEPGAAEEETIKHREVRRYGFLMVWFLGMVCIGGYMLAGQVRLILYLRHMRQQVPLCGLPGEWAVRLGAKRIRVYKAEGLPVPCLIGRSIYLAPYLLDEDDRLRHVLAHEYAHAVQGDSLWAIMRSVLCVVYWFFPPVWIAAYGSKQDSELACDEKAVRILGEREQYAYGRTLLEFVSGGRRRPMYKGMALSMGGSGRWMKERVMMIAGKRKSSRILALLAALAAALACGCAFMGTAPDGDGRGHNIGSEESGKDMARGTDMEQDGRGVEAGQHASEEQNKKDRTKLYMEAAEAIEQGETETIRKRLDAIEKEWMQATASEFWEIAYSTGDAMLDSAQKVELDAYFDYLYEGAQCPLQDGTWYLLGKDEEDDIFLYGLYTEQFGLRGVKMKVAADVNTFDIPWIPSYQDACVEVLEWAEDGAPRTFAFQNLVRNDGTHEIWQLYVADRYDTGTVDLYPFEPEDYIRQFQDMVELRVNREAQTVELVCGEDTVGSVDISRYREYTVKEAVWEAAAVSFLPNAFAGAQDYEPVAMVTGIGLKVEETEVIQYSGLMNIVCPVDIGVWGERSFTLGTPYVAADSFHGGA